MTTAGPFTISCRFNLFFDIDYLMITLVRVHTAQPPCTLLLFDRYLTLADRCDKIYLFVYFGLSTGLYFLLKFLFQTVYQNLDSGKTHNYEVD